MRKRIVPLLSMILMLAAVVATPAGSSLASTGHAIVAASGPSPNCMDPGYPPSC